MGSADNSSIDHNNDVIVDGLLRAIILGSVMAYGILTSLFLILAPICPRMRLPSFVVFSSWALVNLIYLCVKGSDTFAQSDWSNGNVWCKSAHFLSKAMSFTRPYLLVVAGVFLVVGHKRFQRWTAHRSWAFVFVPYAVTMLMWGLIFLPCMEYRSQARIKEIQTQGVSPRQYCVITPDYTSRLTELVIMYIAPPIILACLLSFWGCKRFWSQEDSDPKEKAGAIILLFLIYLFVASHFTMQVRVPFPDGSEEAFHVNLADPQFADAYRLTEYLDLADYVLSPTVCIAVLVIYRRAFFGKVPVASKPGETDEEAIVNK